ncbi:MAG: metallophosphatase family protein [Clostridia bacterium]|nr:metallophosphatase family protein [Clostridia bacterium]
MRIGVISDTHIPRKSKALPQALVEGLRGVDLILHAGDISRDYVIYELEEIAPVEAVAGNVDDDYLLDMLGRKKIISAGGIRIGLIHGDGSSGTTLQRVQKAFNGEPVHCIIFGHSHIPFSEWIEGVLYFNPGSPTDKRREANYSYGILEIHKDNIEASIKYF